MVKHAPSLEKGDWNKLNEDHAASAGNNVGINESRLNVAYEVFVS